MVDKVKPLKLEDTNGGTEVDPFPTSMDPSEDYIATKGVAFENSDSQLIDLSISGEVQYKDSVQTTYKKLNDIGDQALAAVFTIVLQHNGTVGGGTFYGYSNLLPGDATPIIIPIDANFRGFAWSNSNSGADWSISIRRNSTGGTPFYTTGTQTNTQIFTVSNLEESFDEGDQIYLQHSDLGGNASDVGIVLFFRARI